MRRVIVGVLMLAACAGVRGADPPKRVWLRLDGTPAVLTEAQAVEVLAGGGRTVRYAAGDGAAPVVVGIVGSGAVPPPVPPPPPPDPPPPPKPAAGKHWVIVVEETEQLLPQRGQFLSSKPLADYMRAKGWVHRLSDIHAVDATGKPPPDLAPYLERAKGAARPVLFVVSQDGTVRHEGPVPETPQGMLTILQQIGGQ